MEAAVVLMRQNQVIEGGEPDATACPWCVTQSIWICSKLAARHEGDRPIPQDGRKLRKFRAMGPKMPEPDLKHQP
jgi:hypothetical protein